MNNKNKKNLNATEKFAFGFLFLSPIALIGIGITGIVNKLQNGLPQLGEIQDAAFDVFFIVVAIVLLKKSYDRLQKRLGESVKEREQKEKLINEAAKESPIWDFSNYPSFPYWGILLTLALFAAGSAVFFLPKSGFELLSGQLEARTWPSTAGVVIHSKVIERKSISVNDSAYKAVIKIAYSVDGTQYQLDEPYFGQSTYWRDNMSAYKERNRFKTKKKLEVHYNPEQPEIAIADLRIQAETMIYSGIMLLLYLFGLMSIYYTVDQVRRFVSSRRKYHDN